MKTEKLLKELIKNIYNLPPIPKSEMRRRLKELMDQSFIDGEENERTLHAELELAIFGNKKASQPLGASKWENHGKRYGYWKYFVEQMAKEIMVSKQYDRGVDNWNDCRDQIQHNINKFLTK